MSDDLTTQMQLVRRLVELGRTARADSAVGTRQPLAAALIAAPGWSELPEELRAEISSELNVAELKALADTGADLVDVTLKPNFRSLGKRFAKDTPKVAEAVGNAEAPALADAIRSGAPATVVVPDVGDVSVTEEDVIITETPREGWAVATVDAHTLALDLHLTPKLERAGLARFVVRTIQEARKSAGLDVSDRITLRWQADSDHARTAIAEHVEMIADDILAVDVAETELGDGIRPQGAEFAFRIEKVDME